MVKQHKLLFKKINYPGLPVNKDLYSNIIPKKGL